MKNRILTLIYSLPLVVSLGLQAEDFDKDKAVSEAKNITQTFAGKLRSELMGAMQTGGPMNALAVCNIEAMPITSEIATDKNAQVSRVSLKNRNPGNIPNEWQRAVLMDFDSRAANGEDVVKMASVEVIDHMGKQRLRFMKALPVGGECLACHGEQLSDDVQAKINELYPDDKATGYSVGQVRGAIVVVKDY